MQYYVTCYSPSVTFITFVRILFNLFNADVSNECLYTTVHTPVCHIGLHRDNFEFYCTLHLYFSRLNL